MEQTTKDLDYYLNLPYTVEVKKTEDGYFAKVLELPGCMTWADTFEELGPMIDDAMATWIEGSLEEGLPIPEPRETEDFSGRVNLRMPKSLHRDLARLAEAEGVSLNQVMVTALARAAERASTSKQARDIARSHFEQWVEALHESAEGSYRAAMQAQEEALARLRGESGKEE
jgi:antitoxin HicB